MNVFQGVLDKITPILVTSVVALNVYIIQSLHELQKEIAVDRVMQSGAAKAYEIVIGNLKERLRDTEQRVTILQEKIQGSKL